MPDSEKERALIKAMEKYKHRLFRLAVSCLKRQADAEHEKAWLIRVTVNSCISLMRSPWRKIIFPIPETIPAPEPESRRLIRLVRRLPSKYAIALHLHYYEDYSVKEIASILRISEGTVKSRLSRARKQLGDLIKKEEYLHG